MERGLFIDAASGRETRPFAETALVRSGAAARIKALGEPEDVVVESVTERGGMEHAVITLVFKGVTARGVLYRTPDGKNQHFLLGRGEPMRHPKARAS